MANPVVHWEFWSREPGKVSDFYAKVFDWKIQEMPDMNYRFVESGGAGGIGGGIMQPKDGPIPAMTAFYIDVPDLAEYGKRIVACGGKILVEETKVAEMGSFVLFSDPEGRVLGLWKQIRK